MEQELELRSLWPQTPVTFSGAQGVLKPLGMSITTEYSLQSETVIAEEET